MSYIDPAFRLRELLIRASGNQSNVTTQEIWRWLLGTTDDVSLLESIQLIHGTIGELALIGERTRNARQRAIIERSVVAVRNLFSVGIFSHSWSQIRQQITPNLLSELEGISIQSEESQREDILEETKLDGWIQEVQRLISEIMESEEQELKNFMCPILTNLVFVLTNYKVFGNDALTKKMQECIGFAFLNSQKPQSAFRDRFNAIVVSITFALSVLANVSQISGFSIKDVWALPQPAQDVAPTSVDAPRNV